MKVGILGAGISGSSCAWLLAQRGVDATVFETRRNLGVPVVTGDIGDRREILANGEAGLLVQPGSAPALAEGMLHLLRDEELRVSLSSSCKLHVSRYSWGKLAQRVLNFYEITR